MRLAVALLLLAARLAAAKMGPDPCHPLDVKWQGIVASLVPACCPVPPVCEPVCASPCADVPACPQPVACPECPDPTAACASACASSCASACVTTPCADPCPPGYAGLRVKDCTHIRKNKHTGMLRGRCWILE